MSLSIVPLLPNSLNWFQMAMLSDLSNSQGVGRASAVFVDGERERRRVQDLPDEMKKY